VSQLVLRLKFAASISAKTVSIVL